MRGDANDDGSQDISDAVAILGFLFTGAPSSLDCRESGDVDGSGILDVTNAVRLLGYLFQGEEPPVPPFPECGPSPASGLGCERFDACF